MLAECVTSLPQQLGLTLKAVQQLHLAVHVRDLVLQVLAGDVYLLAELSKHTCQLPEHKQQGHKAGLENTGFPSNH